MCFIYYELAMRTGAFRTDWNYRYSSSGTKIAVVFDGTYPGGVERYYHETPRRRFIGRVVSTSLSDLHNELAICHRLAEGDEGEQHGRLSLGDERPSLNSEPHLLHRRYVNPTQILYLVPYNRSQMT